MMWPENGAKIQQDSDTIKTATFYQAAIDVIPSWVHNSLWVVQGDTRALRERAWLRHKRNMQVRSVICV